MVKQAIPRPYPTFDAAKAHDAFDSDGSVKALIKIEGLKFFQNDDAGEQIFELSGLKRRDINMHDALIALGFTEEELTANDETLDQLGEKICRMMQDHDLMNLLRKQVKFIG